MAMAFGNVLMVVSLPFLISPYFRKSMEKMAQKHESFTTHQHLCDRAIQTMCATAGS
jgi:hypothetical protein